MSYFAALCAVLLLLTMNTITKNYDAMHVNTSCLKPQVADKSVFEKTFAKLKPLFLYLLLFFKIYAKNFQNIFQYYYYYYYLS